MATKLLIVHGYSDGSTSFSALGEFFIAQGMYDRDSIDPSQDGFLAPDGPGTLALEALREVRDLQTYEAIAQRFASACESNYAMLPAEKRDRFQQFFFRVRDDIDHLVEDYYIDFYVVDRVGKPHEALTVEFDENFETQVYRHSVAASHRVFMMNCSQLDVFDTKLRAADAILMLEITGVSPLPDVRYEVNRFVAYDPMAALRPGESRLLCPNTTTLVVDVILNRRQTDRLLVIKDGRLTPVAVARMPAPRGMTGRAALVRADGT